MSRRYPKPSIRPERFRLNPCSPLYHELQFAYLGGQAYETKTAVLIDASPYQRHGTHKAYDEYGDPRGYSQTLKREYIRLRHYSFGVYNKGFAESQISGYPWRNNSISMNMWVSAQNDVSSWLTVGSINTSPPATYLHLGVGRLGADRGQNVAGETVTRCVGADGESVTARHFSGSFPNWTWIHLSSSCVRSGGSLTVSSYSNGKFGQSNTASFTPQSPAAKFILGGGMFDGNEYNNTFNGFIADYMVWYRQLFASEHTALADPDNVDLRVPGGPPLILPVRTYWPGFTLQEAPPTAQKVPWHLFTTSA